MLTQIPTEDKNLNVTTPYYIFKNSIRSEITRKYYERRIRIFFNTYGKFISPYGITFNGHNILSDYAGSNVQRFSLDGIFLQKIVFQ